jgi:hypothetical protein
VPLPKPVQGLVIRYSYLWFAEHRRGQEEGTKDRPCAVILATTEQDGRSVVSVLPITHAAPAQAGLAIEIPAETKERLGLDGESFWVVLTEANRFFWPGPDLRPASRDDGRSVAYGLLPHGFAEEIPRKFIILVKARRAQVVRRTE